MRLIAVTLIVVSILISGCVGVNGEPLVIPNGKVIYEVGFIDGCMTGILALTTPQNLPTYEEALGTCYQIYDAAQDGYFGEMPSQMNDPISAPVPEVTCDSNCI